MDEKIVSELFLALLLLSVLASAFGIQPIRASRTIYIRPDGSVEGTDKILRDGDVRQAQAPDPVLDMVYVDPVLSTANTGESFTINVDIDVESLKLWEIQLGWDPDILECTAVEEGPFLKSGGQTDFVCDIYPEYLYAECILLEGPPGPHGRGTLMTVTFHVLDEGFSVLEIFYSRLLDHELSEITHVVTDGYFSNGHDITVTDVAPSKTVIGAGYSQQINATIHNIGSHDVSNFDVSIYYGNDTISPEQWETFWSMGDVNRNGLINDNDGDLISAALLSTPSDPNWCPWADLNKDLIINVLDLTIWSSNYGLDIWAYTVSTFITPEMWDEFWSMGDINRDGYIDMTDYDLWLAAYGSTLGDPSWNPDADLNEDGTVNLEDFVIWQSNYGLDFWTYYDIPTFAHVETQTVVDLPSMTSITVTFTWDTTGIAYGNYIISAYAVPILCNETYRADNNYGDGNVIVTIPGDIDGDYYVGSADAGILAMAYGSWRGDPIYVPEADFDCDGYIGSADAGILSGNYGETAV